MRVRSTSINTYHRIVDEGLLSQRRLQVYEILFHNGPLTGSQVARLVKSKYGSWSQSETIRNRLTELRDMKCVIELGEVKCPTNGNTVILWDVTDSLPVKLDLKKKPTRKQLEKRLEMAENFFHEANEIFKDNIQWHRLKIKFKGIKNGKED